jgi:hypothetical protein
LGKLRNNGLGLGFLFLFYFFLGSLLLVEGEGRAIVFGGIPPNIQNWENWEKWDTGKLFVAGLNDEDSL